ncbi:uncharacterized protein BX663DRAFT_545501 [Cokeromyces recurvatus]|uniref:uncharacterized protein n=1 Tax=Cokeromyces recurvatus TaxID=90255 RepID=UPI00221FB272|nr:uncharacterized protein BX663DRAFT_545501 [Cokeromyces recurvatus]KAI7899583.1 hypothetical protein BX663DRAFT_545501 [Cokeromyces recurvatus]
MAKIVIAHHPYEASRDDEISFVKDEVIKVTDDSDPDWWVGKKKDGSLGFFPSNFVDIVENNATGKPNVTATLEEQENTPIIENNEESIQNNPEFIENDQEETPLVPEEKKVDQIIGMARVMEDYAMQEPGEISLSRGGIINVYEIIDDEWQRGELNGKVGIFPSKYVEDIDMPGRPDLGRQQIVNTSENPKPSLNDENNSARGFKLAAYGVKQGGIGSLFAGGLPGLKKIGITHKQGEEEEEEVSKPNIENKNEATTPPSVPEKTKPKPFFSTSGVPAVPAFTAYSDEPAEPSIDPSAVPLSAPPAIPSLENKALGKAIVLHPYEADNDDELNLLRGEYVDILDRHADEGWWKGKNERGYIGVFPSNFVKEIENDIVAPPMPSRSRKSVMSINSDSTTTESRPTSITSNIARPPLTGPRPSSVQSPSMTQKPIVLNQRPSSVQALSSNVRLPTPPKAFSPPIPQVNSPSPISEESIKEEEQYEADEEKPTSPERSEVEESPAFTPIISERALSFPTEKEESIKSPIVVEEEPISDDEVKESGVDEEPFKLESEKLAKTEESRTAELISPVEGEQVKEKEEEDAPKKEDEQQQLPEAESIEDTNHADESSVIQEKKNEEINNKNDSKEQMASSDEEFKEASEELKLDKKQPIEVDDKLTEEEKENTEKEIPNEVAQENSNSFNNIPSGPKLVNPTRIRFGGGRARRLPQTPSHEPSQMEILQKELESTPEPDKEETKDRSTSPEKPTKPIKPIFAKFPTPFAAGAPEEIFKRNLKPTQTRRLWEQKPETEENNKKTTTTTTPEDDVPVRPTGVKNIASRFNFNNNSSSSGHEVLETKLKNHTKNEIEKVRKEFEKLLQEERDKRIQLETIVNELIAKIQALEN